MYRTDNSARDSPAIPLPAGIDQMAATVIVVVHFDSITYIYFGRAGNAHGNGAFRLVRISITRAMDLQAVRRYARLLERCL